MKGGRGKQITSSPYAIPKCIALQQLLEEIQHFQSYLHHTTQQQNSDTSVLDQAYCDDSHFKCIEYVHHLSKKACIYLLQNWLLSLALCDVSFFVTFQYSKECNLAMNDERQTCDRGGIIVHCCSIPLRNNNNDELTSRRRDIAVHYEVKVIDCDPKPAKKLRHRREVENAFRFVTT
jgi:hypothetical protein